jgi:hypothetical protein
MLRVHGSALKHGHTRETISHAHDMAIYEAVLDPEHDPPKLLIIGPDKAGNLLELIGADLAGSDRLIWHAMPCRTDYLQLLPKTGGSE